MTEQAETARGRRWRRIALDPAAFTSLILGFAAYAAAAFSIFSIPQLSHVGLDQVAVAFFTSIAGLLTVGLGYESIVLLGGVYSLTIASLIARVTRTRQLIEPKEKSLKLGKILIEKSHLVYLPALLFFTSIALGWDIYNADLPKAASTTPTPFRLVLRSLNFLATPQRANAVLFSLRLTSALIIITLISGVTPSIALPYFRQFKITGINSGPFHSSLLTAVVGSLAGLSIILSLLGIFYKVLWAGGAPTSYHYAIIVLIGLSLHYAAGTYIGRERAESIILRRLANGEYDRRRMVVIDQSLNPNAEEIALRSLVDL